MKNVVFCDIIYILSRLKMNLWNESAISGAITTQGVCQTALLYQNQTSVHQLNQQTIQQIQPIYTSYTKANTNQADILLQNNIPSCSNQDGGLHGDGFSWYSDEDITFYSKTTYHHAATRTVDSAETASAGTAMKISHFTPKQHTIMQQPGRWTPRRRLQLVQR
jgi:hypothetical protein